MRGAAYNTAKAFQEALEKAEQQLPTGGRPTGADATVELLPSAIEVRPELFQPREFSFGLHATDMPAASRRVAPACTMPRPRNSQRSMKASQNWTEARWLASRKCGRPLQRSAVREGHLFPAPPAITPL